MQSLSGSRPADDGTAASFPALPYASYIPKHTAVEKYTLDDIPSAPNSAQWTWSGFTGLKVALVALIARYTYASTVIFGSLGPKGNGPVRGADNTGQNGPSPVPTKIVLDPEMSLKDLLDKVQKQESMGCALGDSASASSEDFQTVLASHDGDELLFEDTAQKPGVLLEYHISCQQPPFIVARYDETLMHRRQMKRFLRQLGGLACQLYSTKVLEQRVGELEALTEADYKEIWAWNLAPLPTKHVSIHGEVIKTSKEHPNRLAISAWDGSLTYRELDCLSSRFAEHLQSLGLACEQVVPVCFEKSKWIVVALLAVLKAGGAFTLIDPMSPPGRIAEICRQTDAKFALVSTYQLQLLQDTVGCCVVVDNRTLESTRSSDDHIWPADPQGLAYVLFTSGSTGTPKGSLIEHGGFVSCCLEYAHAMGLDQNTRALQNASYAFGACLFEMLAVLLCGGCICVPSDEERSNRLFEFVAREKVNWAFFTPSYLSVMQPNDIPGVRKLAVGGEPMSLKLKNTWASVVELMNVYGQSETSSACGVVRITAECDDIRSIGFGIGARLWITEVDNVNKLAAIGAIGELVVQSPGTGRGYLHEAVPNGASSSSPFLQTPPLWYPDFEESEQPAFRFYRTGDLVRYLQDGQVTHLGRIDGQLKINGQRIEIGDIEHNVERYLRQYLYRARHLNVAVEAVTKQNSGQILVAFIETDDDTQTAFSTGPSLGEMALDQSIVERIMESLKVDLPPYSIPRRYIKLCRFPMTATGKTDRRAMREVAAQFLDSIYASEQAENTSEFANQDEKAMQNLWARVLHLSTSTVGSRSNFFQLGGDSVDAIRLVHLGVASGLRLQVHQIIKYPVLQDLVRETRQVVSPAEESVTRAEPGDPPLSTTLHDGFLLSSAQERLWFLDLMKPNGAPWYYNIPLAFRLRGPLVLNALDAALAVLEERHETLRTTFQQNNSGKVVQVVGKPRHDGILRVADQIMTYDGALAALESEQKKPFLLSAEYLWRVLLIRCDDGTHVLSLVLHHIIADGWSVDVLCRDLVVSYTCSIRGHNPFAGFQPLPVQYRHFAAWQQIQLGSVKFQDQLEYWKTQLEGSRPAELLCDHLRPDQISGQAGIVRFSVTGHEYERMHRLCDILGVTPFVLLLAAFRATHYRLTQAEQATIGIPAASRTKPELQDLIGFFVNTQCIRLAVSENDSFESLVRQTGRVVNEALQHEEVPFERLVAEVLPHARDSSRNPLVQLMFALHSQVGLGQIHLPNIESTPITAAAPGLAAWTRFDVEFHLYRNANSFDGVVLFATDLFDVSTIEVLVAAFQAILTHGAQVPSISVPYLPLAAIATDNRDTWMPLVNDTPYPRDASIVDIFNDQCARTPKAIAVEEAESQTTYQELDRMSNKLATWLLHRNLKAEALVAVLAPRSCHTIVSFLGILKAGLAYLPLDVNAPVHRNKLILTSSTQCSLVLLGRDLQDLVLDGCETVRIDDALQYCESGPISRNPLAPKATALAYVIFTSGSTGTPKGVMIEHRGVVRLVCQSNFVAQQPSDFKVAHLSNLAFDASTWEIYSAILRGGTILCVDHLTVIDIQALGDVFQRHNVRAAMLTPALLKQCLERYPSMIRQLDILHAAGDRFDTRDAHHARSLVRGHLFNSYGPTENTVISTFHEVSIGANYPNGVPIGRAVSQSGAVVMDFRQRPVPCGILGELVVVGDGLARGYMDSALNINRFIEIDFRGTQVRAYRTGDRVRSRPTDGQIEYFGRIDRQIKRRGNRIELGEIEQAILECHSVGNAAAVLCANGEEELQLIAFVTPLITAPIASQMDSTRVEDWALHFDSSIYERLETLESGMLGHDFVGWKSMIDGQDIDKFAMEAWLIDTMSTILPQDQAPGHVLEIGTGTGMVLFNLGLGLESYIGLEPSRSAAVFVMNAVRSMPDLTGKVQVVCGTAMQISQISPRPCPDLVILNSVVQYFPSMEYLNDVVECILRLDNVKRIVFGDVRSYALYREFRAAKALHDLNYIASKAQVRQRMREIEEEEEELLVSPLFFTQLQDRFPESIEHVEILPKIMHANNELSTYRYAAVLHIRSHGKLPLVVQEINSDRFDFEALDLTPDSLANLLSCYHTRMPLAINNIPLRNLMMDREIISMLDSMDDIPQQGASWRSEAEGRHRRRGQMSTLDLVDVAHRTECNVKLSWARQSSQHGALDAVFYRPAQFPSQAEPMFRFPRETDTPTTKLTNRVLRQVSGSRLSADIIRSLRMRLPAYMVPDRVLVVNEMPLNASTKVDRRELENMASLVLAEPIPASISNSEPTTETETALCQELAKILGVDSICPTDSFFNRGGHSLIASRFAAQLTRRMGVPVSVRDIFSWPVIRDLASRIDLRTCCDGDASTETMLQEYVPFQLLAHSNDEVPLRTELGSLLPAHLTGHVSDCYPVTQSQRTLIWSLESEHSIPMNTFYLDLPGDTECTRLKQCCLALMERFDIMRTVFLKYRGDYYQIVLDQSRVDLEICEVDDNLDEATNSFRDRDSERPPRTGEPFIRIAILRKRDPAAVRLVLRMSHAIYDGISFDAILRDLSALYENKSLPLAASFACYVQFTMANRRQGHEYWRELLAGSSMTILRNLAFSGAPDTVHSASITIHLPSGHQSRDDGITQATIFTAAWAKVLAQEVGSEDVVFGRLVSGREALPVALQSVVGPCMNIVPVRVHCRPTSSATSLLPQIQRQYLAGLPFSTLGIDEVQSHCTDWVTSGRTNTHSNDILISRLPWSWLTYQNHVTMSEFRQQPVTLQWLPYRGLPTHGVDVVGTPDPDGVHLHILIYAFEAHCAPETMERMLNHLALAIVEVYNNSLREGNADLSDKLSA